MFVAVLLGDIHTWSLFCGVGIVMHIVKRGLSIWWYQVQAKLKRSQQQRDIPMWLLYYLHKGGYVVTQMLCWQFLVRDVFFVLKSDCHKHSVTSGWGVANPPHPRGRALHRKILLFFIRILWGRDYFERICTYNNTYYYAPVNHLKHVRLLGVVSIKLTSASSNTDVSLLRYVIVIIVNMPLMFWGVDSFTVMTPISQCDVVFGQCSTDKCENTTTQKSQRYAEKDPC